MKKKIQIFEKPPENFKSQVTVAGCYLEWEKRVLLLKRSPGSLQGDTWCLPGGKVEEGESKIVGAIRELHEETGFQLNQDQLTSIGTLYIRLLPATFDYSFGIFFSRLSEKPHLHLDLREHIDAKWVPHEEALHFPLILGGQVVLEHCRVQIEKLG